MEAAIRTGFSDQSHFTNYFNQFIGLAPGTYREIFSEKDGDGSVRRGYPGEYTQVRGNQPPLYRTNGEKLILKRLLHKKARSCHQQNFMHVFVDIYDIHI